MTVVFIHIPKTAGTSLMAAFKREYGRGLYRIADNRSDPRGLADFREMGKSRIRAVAGHIPYGIDEQIPGPVGYVTMLREPSARLASLYGHAVRFDHPLHDVAVAAGSPSAFVESRCAAAVDNNQTRMLAGGMNIGTQRFDRPVTDDDLERAVANLESFAVAGLTERYEESLRLIADRFGWRRRLRLRHINRTSRPVDTDPDPEVDAFDRRLYKVALSRFTATASPR